MKEPLELLRDDPDDDPGEEPARCQRKRMARDGIEPPTP
jgi:hypothetical protein